MTASVGFAKVLDAVLTYGHEEHSQRSIKSLTGAAAATVRKGLQPFAGHEPLLLAKPIRFSPEMGLVLAFSVGSESVRAGLVDANGEIHYRHSAPAGNDQLSQSPEALLDRVRHQAIRVLEDAFESGKLLRKTDGTLPLLGAALALPAPVDRDHILRGRALTHEGWNTRSSGGERVSLNNRLSALLGPPFQPETAQVMNDCNAAAVAIAFECVREREPPRKAGAPREHERTMAMVVRVSGGVGAGMIEIAGDSEHAHVSRFLKSRVMVGTNGLAGELGHLPISRSAIERINDASKSIEGLAPLEWNSICTCGEKHHLQALVGWKALCERLGLPTEGPETRTSLLEKYINPQPGQESQAAVRALEDAGRIIGRALTGTVLALDPHSITVLGALAGPNLLHGLASASDEWSNALWRGRKVAFEKPRHGSTYVSLRGAGLALIRAQRHRKLREIGAGRFGGLTPLLPYSQAHFEALRDAEIAPFAAEAPPPDGADMATVPMFSS